MYVPMIHVSMVHVSMVHVYMMHVSIMRCMYPWWIYPWYMYSWCGIFVMHVQTSTLMHIYIMHVCIMHIHMLLDHVCTMHLHMLLDNDAYVHDAYICDIQSLTMLHVCMMRLKFCDQPTNGQGEYRSRMGRGRGTWRQKMFGLRKIRIRREILALQDNIWTSEDGATISLKMREDSQNDKDKQQC